MTGEELKAIRNALGLSAQAFAEEVGAVDGSHIRKMESGRQSVPPPISILANFLAPAEIKPCRGYVPAYTSVKLNRAMQIAEAGAYPDTFGRLLAHVPASLRDELSARQIAEMVDALDRAFTAGRVHAHRGVLDEGGVYDAGTEKFRPLRP